MGGVLFVGAFVLYTHAHTHTHAHEHAVPLLHWLMDTMEANKLNVLHLVVSSTNYSEQYIFQFEHTFVRTLFAIEPFILGI